MRDLPIVKQLLDLSQDCVKQLDLDGTILAINAPGLALLRVADEHTLLGKAWVPMWPPSYQAVVSQALEGARMGQRVQFVAASQLPDQTERWWSVVVGPLAEVDGRVMTLGAISREVTERVQLEHSLDILNNSLSSRLDQTRRQLDAAAQELDLVEMARLAAERVAHQAQKGEAIGQLVVGMGHDFNNNLQTVLSALDAVPSVGELTAVQERFLGFARTAAQHAALMSRRLLAFSRVHPFTPERMDLPAVVGEVVPLLEATLGRDVAVAMTPAATGLLTFADAHSIQQGLMNLCLNAKDAFHGKGVIAVRFGTQAVGPEVARVDLAEGDYVFVEVEDNGVGMNDDVREKLFQPFFTTKPEGMGTGLGMAQVLAAVRQAGGGVDVHSEVGKGTRVRMLFPQAPTFPPA